MVKKINFLNLKIITFTSQNPIAQEDVQKLSAKSEHSTQGSKTKRRISWFEHKLRKSLSSSNLKFLRRNSDGAPGASNSISVAPRLDLSFKHNNNFLSDVLKLSNYEDSSIKESEKMTKGKEYADSKFSQHTPDELAKEILDAIDPERKVEALQELSKCFTTNNLDAFMNVSNKIVNYALGKCKDLDGMDPTLMRQIKNPAELENPEIFGDVARCAFALKEKNDQSKLLDILTVCCICRPDVRAEIADPILNLIGHHEIDRGNFVNLIRLLDCCVESLDLSTSEFALDYLSLAICVDEMPPEDHAATLALLNKIINHHSPSQDVLDAVVHHISEAILKKYITNDGNAAEGNLTKAQELCRSSNNRLAIFE